MKTGEGKTLTATLPLYLNALTGRGVHVITVNDYLAKRDSALDGQGLPRARPDVGCIQHEEAFLYDPHLGSRKTLGSFHSGRCRAARPTPPTSPTAPTTSSASTTCATTWLSIRRPVRAARSRLRHRRRGRQHPDRRSAHAADHLRPGRAARPTATTSSPRSSSSSARSTLRGRSQAQVARR